MYQYPQAQGVKFSESSLVPQVRAQQHHRHPRVKKRILPSPGISGLQFSKGSSVDQIVPRRSRRIIGSPASDLSGFSKKLGLAEQRRTRSSVQRVRCKMCNATRHARQRRDGLDWDNSSSRVFVCGLDECVGEHKCRGVAVKDNDLPCESFVSFSSQPSDVHVGHWVRTRFSEGIFHGIIVRIKARKNGSYKYSIYYNDSEMHNLSWDDLIDTSTLKSYAPPQKSIADEQLTSQAESPELSSQTEKCEHFVRRSSRLVVDSTPEQALWCVRMVDYVANGSPKWCAKDQKTGKWWEGRIPCEQKLVCGVSKNFQFIDESTSTIWDIPFKLAPPEIQPRIFETAMAVVSAPPPFDSIDACANVGEASRRESPMWIFVWGRLRKKGWREEVAVDKTGIRKRKRSYYFPPEIMRENGMVRKDFFDSKQQVMKKCPQLVREWGALIEEQDATTSSSACSTDDTIAVSEEVIKMETEIKRNINGTAAASAIVVDDDEKLGALIEEQDATTSSSACSTDDTIAVSEEVIKMGTQIKRNMNGTAAASAIVVDDEKLGQRKNLKDKKKRVRRGRCGRCKACNTPKCFTCPACTKPNLKHACYSRQKCPFFGLTPTADFERSAEYTKQITMSGSLQSQRKKSDVRAVDDLKPSRPLKRENNATTSKNVSHRRRKALSEAAKIYLYAQPPPHSTCSCAKMNKKTGIAVSGRAAMDAHWRAFDQRIKKRVKEMFQRKSTQHEKSKCIRLRPRARARYEALRSKTICGVLEPRVLRFVGLEGISALSCVCLFFHAVLSPTEVIQAVDSQVTGTNTTTVATPHGTASACNLKRGAARRSRADNMALSPLILLSSNPESLNHRGASVEAQEGYFLLPEELRWAGCGLLRTLCGQTRVALRAHLLQELGYCSPEHKPGILKCLAVIPWERWHAEVTGEDACSKMASDTIYWDWLERIMRICQEDGVFLLIKGLFHMRTVDISKWMKSRRTERARLSGRDAHGEHVMQLGEYFNRMLGYNQKSRPWDGALGSFTVSKRKPNFDDLAWLEHHPLLGEFLPWRDSGSLQRWCALASTTSHQNMPQETTNQRGKKTMSSENTSGARKSSLKGAASLQCYRFTKPVKATLSVPPYKLDFGPYCFGGDQTRRNELRGVRLRDDPRAGFGGSTMHSDGMGSFSALGGIKSGIKVVTAVEAPDAPLAYKLANFVPFAKPGGNCVNLPITETIKEVWRKAGVRFGTFQIEQGDFYAIPPSVPHEFVNQTPCLSVAWNCSISSPCLHRERSVKSETRVRNVAALTLRRLLFNEKQLDQMALPVHEGGASWKQTKCENLKDHAPKEIFLERIVGE